MTKLDLQKELLEKVKPGMKPSDLKKQRSNEAPPKPVTKPLSTPLKDDGYSSGYESDKSNQSIPTAPPLPNQNLSEQIQALQKQPKPTGEPQFEVKPSTFTCSSCTRPFNIELIRLVKKSGKQIYRNCTLLMLKRANQLTGQRIVLKIKSDQTKPQPTFTCPTCQQPSSGEPHPVHITNFQEQGISPRQLTSVCSTCLKEKVILADFYCLRTSESRDTYNPHEPQFDCDCPTGTNERSRA